MRQEGTVVVVVSRCVGCGACIEVCAAEAVNLVEDVARIDPQRCTGCGACVEVCPQEAIVPVIEGELVEVEDERGTLTPSQPGTITSRPATGLLAAVGSGLAFVAREVVPRVAVALVNAWDRRQEERAKRPSSPARRADETDLGERQGRGQRRRRRKRGA